MLYNSSMRFLDVLSATNFDHGTGGSSGINPEITSEFQDSVKDSLCDCFVFIPTIIDILDLKDTNAKLLLGGNVCKSTSTIDTQNLWVSLDYLNSRTTNNLLSTHQPDIQAEQKRYGVLTLSQYSQDGTKFCFCVFFPLEKLKKISDMFAFNSNDSTKVAKTLAAIRKIYFSEFTKFCFSEPLKLVGIKTEREIKIKSLSS